MRLHIISFNLEKNYGKNIFGLLEVVFVKNAKNLSSDFKKTVSSFVGTLYQKFNKYFFELKQII